MSFTSDIAPAYHQDGRLNLERGILEKYIERAAGSLQAGYVNQDICKYLARVAELTVEDINAIRRLKTIDRENPVRDIDQEAEVKKLLSLVYDACLAVSSFYEIQNQFDHVAYYAQKALDLLGGSNASGMLSANGLGLEAHVKRLRESVAAYVEEYKPLDKVVEGQVSLSLASIQQTGKPNRRVSPPKSILKGSATSSHSDEGEAPSTARSQGKGVRFGGAKVGLFRQDSSCDDGVDVATILAGAQGEEIKPVAVIKAAPEGASEQKVVLLTRFANTFFSGWRANPLLQQPIQNKEALMPWRLNPLGSKNSNEFKPN